MTKETFKNLKRGDLLTVNTAVGSFEYKIMKGYEKRKDGEGYVVISGLGSNGKPSNKFNFYESQAETIGFELYNKKGNENNCPSVEVLLKVFWMFDEHGLIRDDLCFDPEHFMETVIIPHWRKWKRKK